jgi:hypothetical protein
MDGLNCPFCDSKPTMHMKSVVSCGNHRCVMNGRGEVSIELWNKRVCNDNKNRDDHGGQVSVLHEGSECTHRGSGEILWQGETEVPLL